MQRTADGPNAIDPTIRTPQALTKKKKKKKKKTLIRHNTIIVPLQVDA